MSPTEMARLERPHQSLLTLYILRSLLSGPAVVIVLPMLLFRYATLRYRFDEDGIHARWGVLFRREVNLAYARIQDIHLTSGLLQRWLGLADVQVQTASGSATAELVIEGFKEFEGIRDFLYTRMRGYRGGKSPGRSGAPLFSTASPPTAAADPSRDELAAVLREAAAELRATRAAVEKFAAPLPPSAP